MEIEEIRKRKRTLEHDILALLNAFIEETGLIVTSLSIDDMIYQMGAPKRVASLSLEVNL